MKSGLFASIAGAAWSLGASDWLWLAVFVWGIVMFTAFLWLSRRRA